MTKLQLINYCLGLVGTNVDSPFNKDFETTVARHEDNGKWFALIMLHNEQYIVNLKCEPMQADFYRSVYKGVTEGYHMNKTHWNSVYLDSDVPEIEIENMVLQSYELTKKKSKSSKIKERSET